MPYSDTKKQRTAQRKHYLKNKEAYHSRNQARRREIRQWFVEITPNIKCKKCGETDRACLDFHHRDPSEKDSEMSKLLAHHASKERILIELKKCDILCANCHRKFHAAEQAAKW
jgi:hypothetical protein